MDWRRYKFRIVTEGTYDNVQLYDGVENNYYDISFHDLQEEHIEWLEENVSKRDDLWMFFCHDAYIDDDTDDTIFTTVLAFKNNTDCIAYKLRWG